MTPLIPLIQLLIHTIEALGDASIIAAQRHDRPQQVRDWHMWDAYMWTIVHILVAALSGDVVFFFTGLISRWWSLQITLNWVRRLSIYHLGNGVIDKLHVRYLGARTGTYVKHILLALSLIYPFL